MSEPIPVVATHAHVDEHGRMRPLWWLFLTFGLISVVVGFLAVSSAFIATLASVAFLGVLLLIAGVTEVVHAVTVRELKSFALHLLAAALYLFTGFFMLEHPVRAAGALTLLLAANFIVGGFLRMLFPLIVRFPSWPWVVLNGAVDLLLGSMILSEWPESSLWVLGLFLGIDLLLHGWSWVILALTLRPATVAP
jgi:uncharacterized membrane protein HdeD (DUF308 family)